MAYDNLKSSTYLSLRVHVPQIVYRPGREVPIYGDYFRAKVYTIWGTWTLEVLESRILCLGLHGR